MLGPGATGERSLHGGRPAGGAPGRLRHPAFPVGPEGEGGGSGTGRGARVRVRTVVVVLPRLSWTYANTDRAFL